MKELFVDFFHFFPIFNEMRANPLIQIIILMVLSFLIIVGYALLDKPLSFGSFTLAPVDLYPHEDVAETGIDSSTELLSGEVSKEVDTTCQKILLIGDSMLEGLMLRFRDYAEFNQHELISVIWYSSQSEWFGTCDTLRYFIRKYNPSYVILVLGANELFVSNIIRKRYRYVQHIVNQIDSLPFVWVGPPNWKEDTGINELIEKVAGPSRYYPSKQLTLNRSSDGAHPTHKAAAVWMDSLAQWIETRSHHPIRLEQPPFHNNQRPRLELLQPKEF